MHLKQNVVFLLRDSLVLVQCFQVVVLCQYITGGHRIETMEAARRSKDLSKKMSQSLVTHQHSLCVFRNLIHLCYNQSPSCLLRLCMYWFFFWSVFIGTKLHSHDRVVSFLLPADVSVSALSHISYMRTFMRRCKYFTSKQSVWVLVRRFVGWKHKTVISCRLDHYSHIDRRLKSRAWWVFFIGAKTLTCLFLRGWVWLLLYCIRICYSVLMKVRPHSLAVDSDMRQIF